MNFPVTKLFNKHTVLLSHPQLSGAWWKGGISLRIEVVEAVPQERAVLRGTDCVCLEIH